MVCPPNNWEFGGQINTFQGLSFYSKNSNLETTLPDFGGKASQMNGYLMDDVTKIALGMDSVVGIELKKKVFGEIGSSEQIRLFRQSVVLRNPIF